MSDDPELRGLEAELERIRFVPRRGFADELLARADEDAADRRDAWIGLGLAALSVGLAIYWFWG